MARGRHPKSQPKSLSTGRPATIAKSTPKPTNLSASKSRQLIRSHHNLNKAHAQAIASGDEQLAAEIKAQLEAQGGLARYQQASRAGQSVRRGGDSSTVLIEWLQGRDFGKMENVGGKLKMLEVGALSTDNACSKSGIFDVTRIDLNAQSPGILKQDFMERPLPKGDDERFDCVSLSLVLNFVPDPKGRGAMLERVLDFLKSGAQLVGHDKERSKFASLSPSLFLVLPAPCLTNSRYLDEDRLRMILENLGFVMEFRKLTAKLAYYLWVRVRARVREASFPKIEVRSGKSRNNFAIVLT